MEKLDILFESEDLIAVNKPNGMLVHRTKIALDAEEFALQILRNQIKQRVYPAHRLDRKTSGVLLFSKSKEADKTIQKMFQEQLVEKTYSAIVRGYIHKEGTIDYPLENNGKLQNAITAYKPLKQFEIDVPSGKFQTSRYTLVELKPKTGRYHQLRKHMAHIFHPIIGDRPHGCNKQNKLWKERFGMMQMMLHAECLEFQFKQKKHVIKAPLSEPFLAGLSIINTYIRN